MTGAGFRSRVVLLPCLLLAGLSAALPAVAQTSVVALWTPDEIVVGADSKTITGRGAGRSTCKIAQLEDSFFFAAAGLNTEPKTGFELAKIVRQAFAQPGTMREKVDDFESLVDTPLTAALQRLKQEEPAFYEHYLENKGQVLQVVFFGLEDGNPELFLRTFEVELISGNVTVVMERNECTAGTCPSTMVFLLGYSGAASAFVTSHPGFSKNGLAPAVEHLVDMEIAEVPQFVGPPVDILRVNRQGASWVKRKAQCAPLRKVQP